MLEGLGKSAPVYGHTLEKHLQTAWERTLVPMLDQTQLAQDFRGPILQQLGDFLNEVKPTPFALDRKTRKDHSCLTFHLPGRTVCLGFLFFGLSFLLFPFETEPHYVRPGGSKLTM